MNPANSVKGDKTELLLLPSLLRIELELINVKSYNLIVLLRCNCVMCMHGVIN